MADHPARILIVDDERRNRELLEVMLKPEGFLLQTAANGQEALAMVAEQGPDLILLDVMMPGMDGYEVTARLKGDKSTKHIPIIMITALGDHDARLRGLTAGAEEFLTKPPDRAELTVRVRNLLRLKAYADYFDQYSQVLEGEVGRSASRLLETERLSESALRYERDRAQRYVHTAAVMLLALDPEGRITLVNPFACSVVGWTPDELLGRDWVETCVPPPIRADLRQKFQNLLSGDLSVIESPVLTRAGEQRVIEWHNTVQRDSGGQVIGTFSSGTDITARNRAVEGLRIAEERMRFALDIADVGTWDMDYQTGVFQWSKTVEAHYGLMPGTFKGTFEAFLERVHPDDREAVLATWTKAMISGDDFTVEHRSIALDGQVTWLTTAGRIFLGEDGEPLRGIGISQNITKRRIRDFYETIGAAQRAAGLTKQLLAFGRQQVVKTAPVDLDRLITDMAPMLARLIGEHIDITLALASNLPLPPADHSQMEQAVMDLVVNARAAGYFAAKQ